ncbi:RagB/SusD family nutrient uptake outer membrane protein, partial [Phocaeicola vulgatus]|nr:RagB/SusD family nutrient uptake outer membrane protein [Phocaeicola vulgatus]
ANCDGGTNKEAIFSINYTHTELENNAIDATATNSGNKGIDDIVMKYDKEAGMDRDVLNARPYQRDLPS